jgi:hypothetical protein
MSEQPAAAETEANYLITAERRASVEAVLFGDMENPSPRERLERVCDALFWNMVQRITPGPPPRKVEQGTIDFMTAEVRDGRTKKESQTVLVAMRRELREAVQDESTEEAETP